MIVFNSLGEIPYNIPQESALSDWISSVMEKENKLEGDIQYKFVNDEELLEVNKFYLNHHDFTDIITFGSSNVENVVSGDIFISYERVLENSKKLNENLINEFLRVIVHGILHLCGYNDKSAEEKEQMRKLEDKYINLYFS